MERKRTSQTNQQKRYITLASFLVLLIINISILVCYLKIPGLLLLQQRVPLWIFIFTILFILTNLVFLFAFFINFSTFLNGILYLCILLIILQFVCGLIVLTVIVSKADDNSNNLKVTPKMLKLDKSWQEFQHRKNCCFIETASSSDYGKAKFSPDLQVTTESLPHGEIVVSSKPVEYKSPSKCKSCAKVNKEEARNLAIYLSTGYIVNIVILGSIYMLWTF